MVSQHTRASTTNMEPEEVESPIDVEPEIPSVNLGARIVMETPKVRPPTMPSNFKQEDSVLNKEKWTQEEVDLLVKCIDNYLPRE